MDYKHCCVIGPDGVYRTFVLVIHAPVTPPLLDVYDYGTARVNPLENLDWLGGDYFEPLIAVSSTIYAGKTEDNQTFYYTRGVNDDAAILIVTPLPAPRDNTAVSTIQYLYKFTTRKDVELNASKNL